MFETVLLVEDDSITSMVCERMITMSQFGKKVVVCRNGREALDFLYTTHNKTCDVEFIFLDLNMPIYNGWDFLDELSREKDKFKSIPPIFILSSTVDPEDRKRAELYPLVKNFISKPLTIEALKNIQL